MNRCPLRGSADPALSDRNWVFRPPPGARSPLCRIAHTECLELGQSHAAKVRAMSNCSSGIEGNAALANHSAPIASSNSGGSNGSSPEPG
jgi:hypothetical protein